MIIFRLGHFFVDQCYHTITQITFSLFGGRNINSGKQKQKLLDRNRTQKTQIYEKYRLIKARLVGFFSGAKKIVKSCLTVLSSGCLIA